MLRQRPGKEGAVASAAAAAAEASRPLDSDEQEKVLTTIAQEVSSQKTFFTGEKWYILPGVMVLWTSLFSWLAVFRRFGVTNPLFYWMPLGPAVAWGISVYLFCSGRALEKQVTELGGLRYNHKEL